MTYCDEEWEDHWGGLHKCDLFEDHEGRHHLNMGWYEVKWD
jgi:hypothetical protein